MKNILKLIKVIGLDNGMVLKANPVFNKNINWERFDEQASRLTDDEIEILCCGEIIEATRILIQHNLFEMDVLLNRLFDGDLSEDFYEN